MRYYKIKNTYMRYYKINKFRILNNFHQSCTVIDLFKKDAIHVYNTKYLSFCLENLINLQELYLQYNHIKILPPEIGNLTNLHKLYLNNNSLTTLPNEIIHLNKLNLLDLSHNDFTIIPKVIKKMTNLRELRLSHNISIHLSKSDMMYLTNLDRFYLDDNPHLLYKLPLD